MTFTEYLYHLAHAIFKRVDQPDSDINKFTQAMGPNYDDAMETIFLLREQALVATATGKALDALGKDRRMPRFLNEEDDLYRGRLLSAYMVYSADGSGPGIINLLKLIGYPDSEIHELFKDGVVVPLFDGSRMYDGTSSHQGGIRWSEFTVKLGIDDDRSFTAADKDLIYKTIAMSKPAHTKMVELILGMDFRDSLPNDDDMGSALTQSLIDPFLREGSRHSGTILYSGVLQHDSKVFYNGTGLHNRLLPGPVEVHRCDDEVFDAAAAVDLQDVPRIFADHQGWPRNNICYTGAVAQGAIESHAAVDMSDHAPDIFEDTVIAPVVRFADPFIQTLPHGIQVQPSRQGQIFYTGAWQHETFRPRSGSRVYGDHPERFAGPRRDGRHRYGRLPGDRVDEYLTFISMEDAPVAVFNDRTGHVFYRDGFTHGSGERPVDVSVTELGLTAEDVYELPGDAMPIIPVDLSIVDTIDLYYSDSQRVPHDGRFIHSQAPFNQVRVLGSLEMSDTCRGLNLYGGMEVVALHDGGSHRWKHHGNLLRLPFARHDGKWSRDGVRRYLEARTHYNDLAMMHDGIDSYGVQRYIHDGSLNRTPGAVPDDIKITVRRGYRRIAV